MQRPASAHNCDAAFPELRAGARRSEADLYDTYARVRSAAPFWRSPWGDVYLSSWSIVDEALSNRAMSHTLRGSSGGERQASSLSDWLIFQDESDHAQLRRTFVPPFRRDSGELAPCVSAIVDRHMSTVPRNCTIDAVSSFTRAVPERVICAMMDIPTHDMPVLRQWSREIRDILDSDIENSRDEDGGPVQAFTDYFETVLNELPGIPKRVGMFDVTELVDSIGIRRTAANLAFIAFSGHETTVHLLGNMLLLLAQQRHAWETVRREPAIAGNLVSEALRLESPVQKLCRWANIDVVFSDGNRLYAGENAVLLLGSANRDPLRFSDPDRIDVKRSPIADLAFGKGAHACLGRGLAMIEGEAVMDWIARNVRDIEIEPDGFDWIANSTFRGLSRLSLNLQA